LSGILRIVIEVVERTPKYGLAISFAREFLLDCALEPLGYGRKSLSQFSFVGRCRHQH
jgi:hypothetical protein